MKSEELIANEDWTEQIQDENVSKGFLIPTQ